MGLFGPNKKDEFKYSNSFFKKASDEELDIEREKVRVKRNSSYDDKEYDKYYNLLNKFDNEIVGRANKKYKEENPNAKVVHHEHGWYLPEVDD